MKILRVIAVIGAAVFLYFSISAFFTYRYTTEKSFSETHLLYRIFPLQLAILTREYSYVRKWNDRSFWGGERFIAVNGRVTVGFDLTHMNLNVWKKAYPVRITVTVNPPEVLSLEIGEIYDPTSLMATPSVWNKVIEDAREYFKRKALEPPNTIRAVEEFKLLVKRTVKDLFPKEYTVQVRVRELR